MFKILKRLTSSMLRSMSFSQHCWWRCGNLQNYKYVRVSTIDYCFI